MKLQLFGTTQMRECSPPPEPAGGYGMALLKLVRRTIVFILGLSVVLVGIVMIVTPGPAIIVIPLGLAILATEFLWARKILETLKRRLVNNRSPQPGPASDARPDSTAGASHIKNN